MFNNPELKDYIDNASVIKTRSLVSAEINLNVASDILTVGNYRYRPHEKVTLDPQDRTIYSNLINVFDINDLGNFYTDATYSDIVVDGGFDEDNIPLAFKSIKEKETSLFSLEDCFGRFRPRSGINKLRFFSNRYTHHANPEMTKRPRYYMPHKTDKFKYWSSYRTESLTYEYNLPNGVVQYGINPEYTYIDDSGVRVVKNGKPISSGEYGISNVTFNDRHYISDAAPFIVYKNTVPANRIIVKMQTNVGTADLGPFYDSAGEFEDPFFGSANQTTPVKWKIEYLQNDIWNPAIEFNENSKRQNGNSVVGPDGYVELAYGLIVPDIYKLNFFKAGEIYSTEFLPTTGIPGEAYLVRSSQQDRGKFYVYRNGYFINESTNAENSFIPQYDWYLKEEGVNTVESFVTDTTAPTMFMNQTTNSYEYSEFQYISGIRVVAETMNKENSTLDIIEISPRLAFDLSDKTRDYSVVKQMSDIGLSGLPVGQLLAGTGSLTLFDYDLAFSQVNTSSIISRYISQNIQIKFYEAVTDVNGYDYYIPIKTLYSEGFPESSNTDRSVTLTLRDMFFYFESTKAPELLLVNASLSTAVSTLLDNIGFSNYVFLRVEEDNEPVIPYFFVPKDKSIAEVLEDLAISTQTAMFFDEYNNFVCMSKNYVLPSETDRPTDTSLFGSPDSRRSGILENEKYNNLANIIDIASQTNSVYNDGNISYTSRYIQRSYSSIRQASLVDRDKTWVYKPALLWEVTGTEQTKSINETSADQSKFALSAIPLNTDLTENPPIVSGQVVVNNTLDLGEGVYWITRFKGFFYANGEIIRYDAVEYSVPGLTTEQGLGDNGSVWISSNREYQNYFSKIPFNGKMYPTGLVRIYSEPNYETIDGNTFLVEGAVAKHGRGQFGTSISYHHAGLNPYWYSPSSLRGCTMDSKYLFTQAEFSGTTSESSAGVTSAAGTLRNGIIKNYLSSGYETEADISRKYVTDTGTIQSSALIMTGKSFLSTEKPIDFISYTYKNLDDSYKHFGTRMRIVGRIQNSTTRIQSPSGSSSYYTIEGNTPSESIVVGAASGGMAIMVNPLTNVGYYFEIAALTENNLEQYQESGYVNNLIFYKVVSGTGTEKAIPLKLWAGLSQIVVDDGNFTGQYRLAGEDISTVYDLGVEYEELGNARRFYLYLNGSLIATVDDSEPLVNRPTMALFVRGNARCMFENIYALTKSYNDNIGSSLQLPTDTAFTDNDVNVNDSFRKYAMSGILQSTYLSGISPNEPPEYSLYFEEFGTIMREAAYMNIRYDKAYPALYSQLSPTFNRIKGYTVSGFLPTAYGAEFMLFNATDTAINLDETSGNYLRIQGITFTQESENQLTVDDYFSKKSDASDPLMVGENLIESPFIAKEAFFNIKTSRLTYGKKEFSLAGPYIQSQDDAESLMGWLTSKIMRPRMSIGVKIFANPMIQLGDIVTVDYKDSLRENQLVEDTKRFVIYNIEYSRSVDGPDMTVYLSEV